MTRLPGGRMLEVSPVRAFSDSYIWLIRTPGDPAGAAIADPGDARPVEDALEREGLRLRAIFVTHHHPDHVGALRDLVSRHGAPVLGAACEEIPVRRAPGTCAAPGRHPALLRARRSPTCASPRPSSRPTRTWRPRSRQAVNCVHATSRRCRLRSASNDASIRSCDAGNPRSGPRLRRTPVGP